MRLIATDLDGTLLRSGGVLSDRTADALRLARRSGATVVVVTARPPRFADPYAGLVDLAVCGNGAVVYDPTARQIVASHALDVPTARKTADALRAALPGIGCAVETGHRVFLEPAFTWRCANDTEACCPEPIQVELGSFEEVLDRAELITKILAHHPTMDVDAMLATAREALGDRVEVTHSGGAGLLEICAAGVTKASTLARMCAERGFLASDVVAFGDAPNDLSVLRWAGTSYAMGNAHPDVLAAVARRTLTNNEDGVAVVLEGLFA
ncbi:hydrolase [Longispora fulva]|uniref:Cof subfamily protein (Haloacid dehalogenase superfamily) n=1 Tax=Longispora fulva TaxID=619741 RepID=A0A8J7KKU4_9ACTN|nr:Cof-type HAD-IIB family hydrolase [Longispora fulva]MBG6137151.1 Cof subfamily protein (haloacid dehalogenase superfamily) [Longispora fulva]GIG61495.1 hydrolase [Longispora fulva]